MSDDLHSEAPWNANMGYTQPGNTNATHNIGLSPLFFERVGEVLINHDTLRLVLGARGQDGILQAANDKGHLFILFGSAYIDPSRTLNGVRVYSLRCLVSTTNSYMINLVSDDTKNETYQANAGVTLPDGQSAVCNIGLSPLSFNRTGYISSDSEMSRSNPGSVGAIWSSISTTISRSYWLYFAVSIWPSQRNTNVSGHSLRCLVSTANS